MHSQTHTCRQNKTLLEVEDPGAQPTRKAKHTPAMSIITSKADCKQEQVELDSGTTATGEEPAAKVVLPTQ